MALIIQVEPESLTADALDLADSQVPIVPPMAVAPAADPPVAAPPAPLPSTQFGPVTSPPSVPPLSTGGAVQF